ncbi:MAG TPA: porin, partial [Thauera aminoaromatica]|nr:porin [Thauera aminoaromatica]
LLASYQQADNTSFVDDLDADLWQVGVVVPVGAAGNVHLGYGEVEYDFEGESSKAKSIGLAYTHAMSKRTTAYVGYNYTDNDDGLTLGAAPVGTADINIDANNKGTVAIEDGEKSKMFVVGVRHTF